MANLDVEIVTPGDAGYERVRHVYSATGRPARVLLPRDAAQTARAIEHARALGGPLAIRSGGHGISSIATNDGGTVIDLRHLNRIEHLGGTRVAIGPGARWGAVARELYGWALLSLPATPGTWASGGSRPRVASVCSGGCRDSRSTG